MIKHIVLLRFKSVIPRVRLNEHENEFRALRTKMPINFTFEWGTNVSSEGLNMGFSHCFQLGFDDARARDQYLVHPAHVEFSNQIKASLDGVLVFDYEVN